MLNSVKVPILIIIYRTEISCDITPLSVNVFFNFFVFRGHNGNRSLVKKRFCVSNLGYFGHQVFSSVCPMQNMPS